ncbi:MAG: methyltransferase [bacterium]|nr:methyltransferase [bacterium]
MDIKSDPYYKKNIKFKYAGKELDFKVSQDLFSSQVIDHGTQRLFRTLNPSQIDNFTKILDLGCGYGPIGLTLKNINPGSTVHLVDRDALALDYCRQNAKLNNLEDLKIYASLGYDYVTDKDFDLIISNIPAKVGEQVLDHMLKDAGQHLVKDGLVAIVVIDAILDYVNKALTSDSNISILLKKSWPGHTVFHYKFLNSSSDQQPSNTFSMGIYDRGTKEFAVDRHKVTIQTTYNLPEFDTLSFETELLLANLQSLNSDKIQNVLIFNPGQGYIPVAISKLFNPLRLALVDRNLQSLVISEKNLINNNYFSENIVTSHQVGIFFDSKIKYDCFLAVLPEKESPEVYKLYIDDAIKLLSDRGVLLLSSSSTIITRLEEYVQKKKNIEILKRERSRGRSIIKMRVFER